MKRKYLKKEAWGVSIWDGEKQTGAAIDTVQNFLGRELTATEARLWKHHSVILDRR